MNPKRRLVYRFHSLPYVTRMEIVGKLKLVAEEDQDLKEEARQIQYLRRAEQNGILDQLWTAVEQQHGVDVGENPFAKITVSAGAAARAAELKSLIVEAV